VKKARILKVSTDELVDAWIRSAKAPELPSVQTGWRFNFGKRLRELSGAKAYILVSLETPDVAEGAMIFQMENKTVPYMAYLEIAPHNKSVTKKYDYVAGCLIAFACRQSFIQGQDAYQGWLTFDVREENPKDQTKLMAVYSSKYKAQRISDTTTMVIGPDEGQYLIEEYLGK